MGRILQTEVFEKWGAGMQEPSATEAERNTALAEWAMSDSCGYFEIWYMREKEIRAFEAASGAATASGPAPPGESQRVSDSRSAPRSEKAASASSTRSGF
jgi:hypothetical protein